MKRRYLTLAIAACVAGVAITAPTQAFRTDTQAAADVSAPTTTQPRFLALDEVPATLASTGGNPAAWTTPATLQGKTYTEAAQSRVPLVAWVESRALADPALRSDVRDMLASGLPVLVTSSAGQERHEMETFGFETGERNAIYRREPSGALRAVSTALEAASADGADAWLHLTHAVMQTTPSKASNARTAKFSTLAASDSGDADDAPILTIFDQRIGSNGRSATQTIIVLRDTTASRDDKLVVVKTQVDVVPFDNGVGIGNVNNVYSYKPDGSGLLVALPDSYQVQTVLSWTAGTSPRVRLADRIPRSDGSTDRKISESIQSKTFFGLSASPDVTRTLAKESITTAGKLPVSLSFAKERVETTGLEMTVKDYSTDSLSQSYPQGIAAIWRFPLANDIRGNSTYFKDGKFNSSTRKFTPMMRRASLETVSTWRLAGEDEQTIRIGSRGTSTARQISLRNAFVIPDQSSYEYSLDNGGLPLGNLSTSPTGLPQNPWVVTRVDLSSPYLTRGPTVLIQSLSGSGQCLMSRAPASSSVVLATCDTGTGNKAQQWNLEADNTYRNRANGQCLTANPSDGAIVMATCARLINQQWKWSADRIHSQYEGGERWRLHVRNGTLNATFDPARHQVMVSNQYHSLLRPWSSYPSAPSVGDVIPNPAGASPPVPTSYFDFGPVSTDQRWQTLPLRQGL